MKTSALLPIAAIVSLCLIFSCSSTNNDEPHSGEFSVSDTQKVVFAKHNLKHSDTVLFAFNHYGAIPQGWRVLNAKEWQYLILQRPNALNLTLWATVKGVKGVLLLPDGFNTNALKLTHIQPQTLKPWSDQIRLADSNADPAAKNILTDAQVTQLDQAGAIFLPLNIGNEGGYWQTGDSFLSLGSTFIWPARGCNTRAYRFGIRLAKDITASAK